MTKILFVGDPHVVPNELEDCQRLMDFVWKKAKENEAEVCILGDLYDKHGIVNVEVLDFWRNSFKEASRMAVKVTALLGNHDRIPFTDKHALQAHENVVEVIDRPIFNSNCGVLYLPYMDDKAAFVKACQDHSEALLVCHQSFEGAQYDNGFYDPDGVDPNAIPQKMVISGHIHTPSRIGKIFYIGAPRWRNVSDANVTKRGLLLFDFQTAKKTPISLDGITSKIIHIKDTEEDPITLPEPSLDRYRVDIYGTKEYCLQRKTALARPGVKIHTFPQSVRTIAVRESEGVSKALYTYLGNFQPPNHTPKEVLERMCRDRLSVLQ